jgi:hypothetical protein
MILEVMRQLMTALLDGHPSMVGLDPTNQFFKHRRG